MARYRNTNLLDKNIASENSGDTDGGIAKQFSNAPPAPPPSSTPNTVGGPRMPEGFVNFDRLLNQNSDTLNKKGAELETLANSVSDEVKKTRAGLHGAGNVANRPNYSFDKILELSLKASQGDTAAQKELESAMTVQGDVEENKPVKESEGYTKGLNQLSSLTAAPNAGQDNYGSGALNYALGDAAYGGKIKDRVKELTSGMDSVKNEAVTRNKEIQDFNDKLKGMRDNIKAEGTKAFNAGQAVASNPMSALSTGDNIFKAYDVRNTTVNGMKYLAKYLGIDPNSVPLYDIAEPPDGNTRWNKDTQSWVTPESLKPPPPVYKPTKEEEREDRMSPGMRARIARMQGY